MYDIASDVFRVINIVLISIIIALMQRARHKIGSNWTPAMMGLHQFLLLLLILLIVGSAERIAMDAQPAVNVFLGTGIFAFGIVKIIKGSKGGYEK